MRDKICHIFGAGSFNKNSISLQKDDYIIAADGGYEHLKRLNINPNMILGDFDSLSEVPNHPNIKMHPKQKDDTDMMIAVKEGLALGYRLFSIYGGLGGRLDHTIANIQIAAWVAEHGARAFLLGEGMVITAIHNGKHSFDKSEKGVVSIFCNGGEARGVYLKNLKYKLVDATLTSTVPTGVSNEFKGEAATAQVRDGTLIIMWNNEDFNL